MRPLSTIASDWWDYTTLDREILNDASKLTAKDLESLSRPGFAVKIYDTVEDFYLAEALEYVTTWMKATEEQPTGICGPAGPVEQMPLIARLVNELDLNLRHCYFWGMDEWVVNGRDVGIDYPYSFRKVNVDGWINRIRPELRMPDNQIFFPSSDNREYIDSWNLARCLVIQGGQGEVKHWAFNDPVKREGKYKDTPPSAEEYRQLTTRIVELHPITIMQNARTSGGGTVQNISPVAASVGPVETWKAEKVSIWHGGMHDNPFGMRLTTLMISKHIVDTSTPMSVLADHPNVQFNFLRGAIGTCDAAVR
ncbi:MAG: glucosamine-6-phosphate isomerase [Anaerolineae bacterium]|nr:glucosamine-6-phosphate isomerase [Anaerolineae bacterium]